MSPPAPPRITLTIAQVVELHVSRVLLECDGNISEAARRLGLARSSLQRMLRRTERDLAAG